MFVEQRENEGKPSTPSCRAVDSASLPVTESIAMILFSDPFGQKHFDRQISRFM